MNDDFIRRFLMARDKDLSPHESWRRKQNIHPENTAHLWFVQPLERLVQEDWESILLAGAECGAHYLEMHFRYNSTSREAMQLMIRLMTAYLSPLSEKKATGSLVAAPHDGVGFIILCLYARDDIPPEHRGKVYSRAEFEELMEPYGAHQIEPSFPHDN